MNTIKGIDFIHRYVGNEINQIPILPCQFPSHQPFFGLDCAIYRAPPQHTPPGPRYMYNLISIRLHLPPNRHQTGISIDQGENPGNHQRWLISVESLHLSYVHLLYASFSALLSFVRLAAMTRRIDTASMTYLLPESNVTHLCDWHQRAGKLATGQAEQPFSLDSPCQLLLLVAVDQ